MSNKFSRSVKKISNFFTAKNNKITKTRKMVLGIAFSALIIVVATVIILVATNSVGAAYRNINFAGTVITKGVAADSHHGHDLIDGMDKQNYSMRIDNYYNDKLTDYYIYTNSISDDHTVTRTVFASDSNITYKSVSNKDKTTYSCDKQGTGAQLTDEIKSYTEGLSLNNVFHNYLHSGGLNCFKYNDRIFLISNTLLEENIYICSKKNSTKIEYAEIVNKNSRIKYTFEYK